MRSLAVAGALLACMCTQDPSRREDLDGLVVFLHFDEPVCDGTFAHLERRLDVLEQVTGLPRDPHGLVFHWIYTRDLVREKCSSGAGACAIGRTLYSDLLSYSHELAHAHLGRFGRPRAWLIEGMAMMLEDDLWGVQDPETTPTDLMATDSASYLDYLAAGAFTAYLRDRYGMAALLRLYEASAGANEVRSREIFQEVFGDAFAAVELDYLARDTPMAVGSPDCELDEVAWNDDGWQHTFDLQCSAALAIGPQDWLDDVPRPELWSNITVEVPTGWFSFSFAATGTAWVQLLRCDRPEFLYLWADQPEVQAYLEAGRYRVTAQGYADEQHTVTITAKPLAQPPEHTVEYTVPPAISDRRHRHMHD